EVLLAGPHGRFRELRLLLRAVRDFLRGFRVLHFVGPCVTIFGSARFNESHPYYAIAREVGRRTSALGFTGMTGGGPGLRETAGGLRQTAERVRRADARTPATPNRPCRRNRTRTWTGGSTAPPSASARSCCSSARTRASPCPAGSARSTSCARRSRSSRPARSA